MTKETGKNLLCFPFEMQVGLRQLDPITGLSILEPAEMLAYIHRWMVNKQPLAAIAQQETDHNAKIAIATRRLALAFYPTDFLYGVYGTCVLLFSQAEERIDTNQGIYPTVTQQAYNQIKDQHFTSSLPLRARFIKEKEEVKARQPELFGVLCAIADGAELRNENRMDFFGGAAFAYQLLAFSH